MFLNNENAAGRRAVEKDGWWKERKTKNRYFPNTAMGSVLNIMADGKSVEVGLVGKEGFIGLPLVAGLRSSASRVVCQAEGMAYRINADNMQNTVLRNCPRLVASSDALFSGINHGGYTDCCLQPSS